MPQMQRLGDQAQLNPLDQMRAMLAQYTQAQPGQVMPPALAPELQQALAAQQPADAQAAGGNLGSIQAQLLTAKRQQELASALMERGYRPHSGGLGAFAQVFSAWRGKKLDRKAGETISEAMQRKIEEEAKIAERDAAAEEAKWQRRYDTEQAGRAEVAQIAAGNKTYQVVDGGARGLLYNTPQGLVPVDQGPPNRQRPTEYTVPPEGEIAIESLPPEQQAAARQAMGGGTYYADPATGNLVAGESPGLHGPPAAAPPGAARPPVTTSSVYQQQQIANARAEEAARNDKRRLAIAEEGNARDAAKHARGPEPTDGERAAKGYLDRMRASEQELSQLTKGGYDPGSIRDWATAGKGLRTGLASGPGQVYRQQQEDWVRAKLRRESGAAIPVEEMEREITTYFPQPLEGPEVIAAKARSRAMALKQFETMAGRAMERGQQPPATLARPAPGPAKPQTADEIAMKYLQGQ